MVLSGIYVIPHGDEILDNPSEGSIKTRKEIEIISSTDRSESVIILSPHGLRLRNKISLINTENLFSHYKTEKHLLEDKYLTDRELAGTISGRLEEYVEEIQFVTGSGELSSFMIDFGTAIPLSFFINRKVISMGQTRTSNREMLVNFGRDLYKLVAAEKKNISIIISADQAHTHWAGGPYGYSEDARKYDEMAVSAINNSDFRVLYDMKEEFIENSKPDSYWNLLILSGILSEAGRKLHVVSYYVEKYFGMLVAK